MRVRGASTVEYALLLVAVILVAAGSYKLLGGRVGTRSGQAGSVVATDDGTGGGGGGNPSGGGGGGGGGKGTGGGNATTKVTTGQAGAGVDTGGGGDATRAPSTKYNKDSGDTELAENITPKRWMGIGLLAAGVIAVLYVLTTMRRTKKRGDALAGKAPALGRRKK